MYRGIDALADAIEDLASAIDDQGNAASPKLHRMAAQCRTLIRQYRATIDADDIQTDATVD